jgi:hypothetical protein
MARIRQTRLPQAIPIRVTTTIDPIIAMLAGMEIVTGIATNHKLIGLRIKKAGHRDLPCFLLEHYFNL